MLRYFVCSDVHDDLPALRAFTAVAQRERADRIFVLGSLLLRPYRPQMLSRYLEACGHEPEAAKAQFIEEVGVYATQHLRAMKGVLDSSGIEYHVLPGECDPDLEPVFGRCSMHNKSAVLDERRVFGYGGAVSCPRQVELLKEWGWTVRHDNVDFYRALNRENAQVCVSHMPPKYLCDEESDGTHKGSLGLWGYVDSFSPSLVLCGHVRESGPLGRRSSKDVPGFSRRVGTILGAPTVVINAGNLGRFGISDPGRLHVRRMVEGSFVQVDMGERGACQLVQYKVPKCEESPARDISVIDTIVF